MCEECRVLLCDVILELAAQRAFTMKVADRLAAASEVLSRLAEPVDREKLKRIATEER